MVDNYGEAHRKHMAFEVERQDRELRRIRINRTSGIRKFWMENSEFVGLFFWMFVSLIVASLAIMVYGTAGAPLR